MKHEKKVSPSSYTRLVMGVKTFEVIENENDVQAGDFLICKEWDESKINPVSKAPKGFTEREPLTFKITYVEIMSSNKLIVSLQRVKGMKS